MGPERHRKHRPRGEQDWYRDATDEQKTEACKAARQELVEQRAEENREHLINPGATIDPTARIERNVEIADRTEIGRSCRIKRDTKINHDTKIGEHCTLEPGCRIGRRVTIGGKRGSAKKPRSARHDDRSQLRHRGRHHNRGTRRDRRRLHGRRGDQDIRRCTNRPKNRGRSLALVPERGESRGSCLVGGRCGRTTQLWHAPENCTSNKFVGSGGHPRRTRPAPRSHGFRPQKTLRGARSDPGSPKR